MKRISYTISALALAAASPAFAEATAADLWAEWQAQAGLTGQTISADVTPTENGLALRNFTTLTQQEEFSARGVMEEVLLTENPDGTVTATFSELYTMTFTFEIEPGDPPGNIEILMRHEGLNAVVSGDPGARAYVYTADRLTFTEGEIWGGGDVPPTIDLSMEMTDLATTYRVFGTDLETMRFSSEASIGGLSMSLEVTPPANAPGRLKMGLMVGTMQSTSSGSVLSLGTLNQVNGTIPPGFEIDGDFTYGPLDLEFSFDEPGQAFAVLYGNEGGSLGVNFSEDAIGYDIMAQGMQTRVTGSELPVPVELAVASSELSFQIPLAAGPAPQDVAIRLAVEELTVGDSLWSMIDPGQSIPRDPATVVLDATGQVQLFVNLMGLDPEALATPPGELRGVSVSELRLSAGGASLSGTADLTFAPGQVVPMPVGSANLQLSGGNGLLDTLIAGGMVPAQQGAFVRGAIAAFARPGAGPDTLETSVEFAPDGTVTANGIPLPF